MPLQFARNSIGDNHLNFCTQSGLTFGFSEKNITIFDLAEYFSVSKTVELAQTHSSIILLSSEIIRGSQGDGIILDERKTLAVIKTADCLPLFFWHTKLPIAGILHIGWRGLYAGIENRLILWLRGKSISLPNLRFYMGPAIKSRCYEVGIDLYNKFARREYLEEVFTPLTDRPGVKFSLDIRRAVKISLRHCGIDNDNIADSGICNHCQPTRFPSYRRDGKGGGRIYSFMVRN